MGPRKSKALTLQAYGLAVPIVGIAIMTPVLLWHWLARAKPAKTNRSSHEP